MLASARARFCRPFVRVRACVGALCVRASHRLPYFTPERLGRGACVLACARARECSRSLGFRSDDAATRRTAMLACARPRLLAGARVRVARPLP